MTVQGDRQAAETAGPVTGSLGAPKVRGSKTAAAMRTRFAFSQKARPDFSRRASLFAPISPVTGAPSRRSLRKSLICEAPRWSGSIHAAVQLGDDSAPAGLGPTARSDGGARSDAGVDAGDGPVPAQRGLSIGDHLFDVRSLVHLLLCSFSRGCPAGTGWAGGATTSGEAPLCSVRPAASRILNDDVLDQCGPILLTPSTLAGKNIVQAALRVGMRQPVELAGRPEIGILGP